MERSRLATFKHEQLGLVHWGPVRGLFDLTSLLLGRAEFEITPCTASFHEDGRLRKQLSISYLSLRLRLLSLDHNRHLRNYAALQATLLTKVRCVLSICKSLETLNCSS